jgi:uncharacterized membrane protein
VIKTLKHSESGDELTIDLYSNLSMSLDRFFAVFMVLSAVTLLIAIYPLALGLWPVMIIALIHVVLVGVCFRSAWRGNWARETICFDAENITIRHLAANKSWQVTWPTTWLRIVSITDKHKENRVYLCQHNQKQEIGGFLPQDERKHLEKIMKKTLSERTAWTTQHKQETMST